MSAEAQQIRYIMKDEMTESSNDARAGGYESNALLSAFGKILVAIYTVWRCCQSVTIHFD